MAFIFPQVAEPLAKAEWERRHGQGSWPLGREPANAFHRRRHPASLAEVAEAEALFMAATWQIPVSEVPSSSPLVRSVASAVQGAVGDPSSVSWRGDWGQWRSQIPLPPPAAEEPGLISLAELIEKSGRLPLPTNLPIRSENLYFFGNSGPRPDGSPQLPNWDNVGGGVELIKRYLGVLTPSQMLANWISIKNGLIHDRVNPRIIKDLQVAIGKLAMDVRHHPDM